MTDVNEPAGTQPRPDAEPLGEHPDLTATQSPIEDQDWTPEDRLPLVTDDSDLQSLGDQSTTEQGMTEQVVVAEDPADATTDQDAASDEPRGDQPDGGAEIGAESTDVESTDVESAEPEEALPNLPLQRFDVQSDPDAAIEAALEAIRAGQPIVLPTDTVYGIGADALNADAVQALLDAKRRGRDMPPPVLIADALSLPALVSSIDEDAQALADAHWPGPLTLILRAQDGLRMDLGNTAGTIAVRVPDHEFTRRLLRRTGPLAVSSANISGQPASTSIDEAIEQLSGPVGVFLDAGPTPGPTPSSIVDFSRLAFGVLVREGALSLEELQQVATLVERPEPPAAEPEPPAAEPEPTPDAEPTEGDEQIQSGEPDEDVAPSNGAEPTEGAEFAGPENAAPVTDAEPGPDDHPVGHPSSEDPHLWDENPQVSGAASDNADRPVLDTRAPVDPHAPASAQPVTGDSEPGQDHPTDRTNG